MPTTSMRADKSVGNLIQVLVGKTKEKLSWIAVNQA